MASWSDVKSYIRANYVVAAEEGPNLLILHFETFEKRSQQVFMEFDRGGDETQWLKVSATVGLLSEVDLRQVLEIASTMVLGAVHLTGEAVMIAHWQQLDTIDGPEVDVPMRLVCLVADLVEQKIHGGDRF